MVEFSQRKKAYLCKSFEREYTMNKYLTYSILQYKHSLVLGEILNVGILFYFHDTNKFEFAVGDATRLKAIYPHFDNSLFNGYIKTIENKLNSNTKLFSGYPSINSFGDYLHKNILAIDAAGYVFAEPQQVRNIFADNRTVVNEYAKLLLPGINVNKPHKIKHNEQYLLTRFKGYLLKDYKDVVDKLNKDVSLRTNHYNHKFDFQWQGSTQNYIKPVSFDLLNENEILNKAFLYSAYLDDLSKNYDKTYSFDFLIAKPQDLSLSNTFNNALDILESTKATKKLIRENEFDKYSQTILTELYYQ